jgi:hypothetical protein
MSIVCCNRDAGYGIGTLECRHDLMVTRPLDLKAYPFFFASGGHDVAPSSSNCLRNLIVLNYLTSRYVLRDTLASPRRFGLQSLRNDS